MSADSLVAKKDVSNFSVGAITLRECRNISLKETKEFHLHFRREQHSFWLLQQKVVRTGNGGFHMVTKSTHFFLQ